MKRNLSLITITILAVSLAFAACGEKNGGNGGIAGLLALLGNNTVSPGSKTLVSFSIVSPASTGVIDETAKTVSVTVPYGTAVTALVATFTTTGASVAVGSTAQTSGVSANDFTNSVTYTVTAADGSTQDYTVTVTIAVNNAKEITAFGFTSAKNSALSTNVTGVISGTNISVTVPYGTTSVTALVATFTTTGASVKIGTTAQTSGTTANDFSSAKTYTVTAAVGSTQDYTVTVTVASASAKEITAFSFPAVSFADAGYTGNAYGTTISGTSITVKLPYGSTTMAATFATTGASVTVSGVPQVSGVTENDFTNPVTYRVTAAVGSTQDYTVTVLFAPAVNCSLNSLYGGVLSSYWLAYASTSTDCNDIDLYLTCDAVNAGSDTFTFQIITGMGRTDPHPPTVPSDTTATYLNGDERSLQIVGPLNSIQSVIGILKYVPPGSIDGYPPPYEFYIYVILMDKNGLKALGKIDMYVQDPPPLE